jgi:uncharacterized protein YbaP (TraB family)
LWEIKPPDSEKKSYLFGTAHLRDPRVFDFSDAMIPAIAQSEAFALEVHPDSVTGAIAEFLVKREDDRYYRNVLSNEEYEQLDARVVSATGKSLDSLEYNSLYFLESLLRPDLDKEGDKETFLDAYLFGIANTLDKEIYGLERFEDQMPNLDSLPKDELRNSLLDLIDMNEEKYREGVAGLVDVYASGNIDRILLMSQGLFSIDEVMVRRNEVMVKSMKRIIKHKSLFAAVGAAHLPGDFGIINLLRKEGYIVSKVESTFTGASNDFVIKPNIKKWSHFEDSIMGYQVKVPGVSRIMPIQDGLEMNVLQDILSGVSFFYFPMDLRSRGVEDMKLITEAVIQRFTNTADSTNVKSAQIQRDGKTFYQVIKKDDDSENTMQIEVFAQGGVLYAFGCEFIENPTARATVDAFFNSIIITEAKTIEVPDVVWKPFENKEGGFVVNLPGEIVDMSREVTNPQNPEGAPYQMNMYMGQDVKNNYNYLIRYNNFPLGFYLENQNLVADEFANSLVNKGSTLISKKEITIEGMPGFDMEIKIQNKYDAKVRYLSRGNRTYLIMAQRLNDTDKASFDNPVFNSFELRDFLTPEYETIAAEDGTYSFVFPKEFGKEVTQVKQYNSPYKESIEYFGLDTNSGEVFLMSEVTVKPFFRTKTKEQFYNEYADVMKDYNDTIYKQESLIYQGMEAKDFYFKNDKTTIVQKYRFILMGDKVITLATYQSPDRIDGPNVTHIMDGLKILKPRKFDVAASKSKAILKALRSKDTLKYNEAVGALDYYEFDPEDERLLQKGLYLELPNDSLYWGAKNLIIYSLGSLGLNSSLPKLREYYHSDESSTNNKLMIFQALAESKTPEAITLYIDLLKNNPPKRPEDIDTAPLGYEVDGLITIKNHGLDILEIQEKDNFRDRTIAYLNRQINRDSIHTVPFLKQHAKEILPLFYIDVDRFLDTSDTVSSVVTSYTIQNYLRILDTLAINAPKVLEASQRLFTDQNEVNYVSLKGFTYYIKHAIEIDTKAVQEFIAPQYYRFEGIQALIEAGKSDLIPKEYLDKTAIAEISLYNAVGYDNNYPDSIVYKDNYTLDGVQYLAFVYTYDSEDEKGVEHLGLVLDEEFSLKNPAQFQVYYEFDEPLGEDWELTAKRILDTYK